MEGCQPSSFIKMSDGLEEVVTMPKHQYLKAVKYMFKQRDKIKQQEFRLKAQDNLSDLLSRKDRELLKLQDTVASLTAGHKLTQEYRHQKHIVALTSSSTAVNQPEVSPSNSSSSDLPDVEEDGAPLSCHKLEEDDAHQIHGQHKPNVNPKQRQRVDVDQCQLNAQQFSLSGCKPSTSDATSTDLPPAATGVSNTVTLESKSGRQQLPRSGNLTLTTTAATNELPGRFSHIVSKDLLDKVMQQNARLKKAIREILHQKGLSVTDYLNKVEYEDVIEMLRSDIRRQEAYINRLKSVIDSRNSGKLDEMAKLCSTYITRISELERKNVILQTYKERCEERLSQADSQTAVLPNELQEEMKMMIVKLNSMQDTVTKQEQQIKASQLEKLELKRTQEELMKNNQKLTADYSAVCRELASLKLQIESVDIEKQTALSQLAVFQEDFNMERREKCEQKDRYESALAKHQEWIRRLANEAQNWRTQCEAAKNEKVVTDERLKQLQQQLKMFQQRQGCATAELWGRQPVTVDSSSQLPQRVSTDGVIDDDKFRCPRCEREFDSSERDKFNEHCQRCSDE